MTQNSIPTEPRPSLGEEIANSVSHGLGLLAALIAGPLLVARAVAHDKPWGVVSASIYAASIVVMYLASTVYHALPPGRGKRVFRTMEHCAIFLLIAGTYTPVTIVALRGAWGWSLLTLVWLLSSIGILLKSVVSTSHRWLPAVLYLALAWLIVVAIGPLSTRIPLAGMMWLLAGGIAYTVGVAFFAAKSVPYCHFIWHLFVLAGTTCHFIAIWGYVV
ncbi:hemolysin III family protein [Rubinisphaera sp.]|uniref:PAQR family membrane homeostasis protein TrhA n=1 Tax=Rubinisphaera sp. TaxID=2024857 RepID=UPI000C104715|nr:hemolysin III family protein [Rubinisphaera sp.]MBV08519.1 hemolysin D [Rubinisphaera sp.]